MNEYNSSILKDVKSLKPILWINENKMGFEAASKYFSIKYEDILDAEERLKRFAPLIKVLFPETKDGIIESELKEIPIMKNEIEKKYNKNININGRVFLKCDSHLKVAGSIKARGGIYEVLKYAETLAINSNLLTMNDDYSILATAEFKKFFSNYKIAVGSTGNLGLSIGIISSALGFQVTVHMSNDAKEWKKQLLREKGAIVIEYNDDYSKAVQEGRRLAVEDSGTHFVDDENSKDLFLGYSVAALRLHEQLKGNKITIDDKHKLYVYLPCGVGGAPSGIAFGLKNIFKDNVHCIFVEPTHSPCMLLGLLTGKYNEIHVRDYGIDNLTEADGLAVGSPSKLACYMANMMIDGVYTIEDKTLFELLALLKDSENIRVEPSAASSLIGPIYLKANENDIHIAWATGGLFLPEDIYESMYKRGKN